MTLNPSFLKRQITVESVNKEQGTKSDWVHSQLNINNQMQSRLPGQEDLIIPTSRVLNVIQPDVFSWVQHKVPAEEQQRRFSGFEIQLETNTQTPAAAPSTCWLLSSSSPALLQLLSSSAPAPLLLCSCSPPAPLQLCSCSAPALLQLSSSSSPAPLLLCS